MDIHELFEVDDLLELVKSYLSIDDIYKAFYKLTEDEIIMVTIKNYINEGETIKFIDYIEKIRYIGDTINWDAITDLVLGSNFKDIIEWYFNMGLDNGNESYVFKEIHESRVLRKQWINYKFEKDSIVVNNSAMLIDVVRFGHTDLVRKLIEKCTICPTVIFSAIWANQIEALEVLNEKIKFNVSHFYEILSRLSMCKNKERQKIGFKCIVNKIYSDEKHKYF